MDTQSDCPFQASTQTIQAFSPSQKAYATEFMPASCVCLHSRLEEDFLKVFGQTVAGSGNSIGNVMKNHMQAGGFGNVTVLYVAGE